MASILPPPKVRLKFTGSSHGDLVADMRERDDIPREAVPNYTAILDDKELKPGEQANFPDMVAVDLYLERHPDRTARLMIRRPCWLDEGWRRKCFIDIATDTLVPRQ